MTFDIYQLDESEWDEEEEAFDEYRNALLERFFKSPEGQAHLAEFPGAGFWSDQLIYYGHSYLGTPLPQMTQRDVEEIVTELFPRKITLLSPQDADGAIEELVALWQYLKREYGLERAEAILEFLQRVAPDFVGLMNDPARFGMAKSFLMMGQAAGFDMTEEKDIDTFIHLYNASLMMQEGPSSLPDAPSDARRGTDKVRRKRKRKAARTARKKRKR